MPNANLSYIRIGITYRCNSGCSHCCVGRYRRRGGRELSRAEIARVAEEASMLGARSATLFGGEPTVRDDLLAIIRDVRKHIETLRIETNGKDVDDEFARSLKDAGLDGTYISVHGPDALRHRDLAKNVSYDSAVRAVHASIDAGLSTYPTVTVTSDLLATGAFEEVIAWAREIGATGVRALYPALSGHWSRSPEVLLSAEERDRIAEIADGTFVYTHIPGQRRYGCNALRGYCYVSPYGEVQPCVYVPMWLGNLREEPLTTIVEWARQDNPWLAQEPCFQPGSQRCIVGEARAATLFGDRMGPLIVPDLDNVVDLGSSPMGDAAASQPRPAADILADIDRISAAGHRHAYVTGGDLWVREDASSIAAALARRSLSLTLIGGPTVAERWPSSNELKRVIVALDASPNAGATPSLPSADDSSLDALADTAAALARRGVELQVWVRGPRDAARELLATLLPLHPAQVLHLSDTPIESLDIEGTHRLPRLRQLLPWLPESQRGASSLMAHQGAVASAFEGDGDERYTSTSAVDLDSTLAAALDARDAPRTLYVSAEPEDLGTIASRLERWLPRLMSEGHRLIIRRSSRADASAVAAQRFNMALLTPETLDALDRLHDLETRSSGAFALMGFGVRLPGPSAGPDSLRAIFRRTSPSLASNHPRAWERLLRDTVLRDSDPPELSTAGTGQETLATGRAGAWPGRRRPWRFDHEAMVLLYRLFVAAALRQEGASTALTGPGHLDRQERSARTEWTAFAEALQHLPKESCSLGAILRRVLDPSTELAPKDGAESDPVGELLERLSLRPSTDASAQAQAPRLSRPADEILLLANRLLSQRPFPISGWTARLCETDDSGEDDAREDDGLRLSLVRDDREVALLALPGAVPQPALFVGENVRLLALSALGPSDNALAAGIRRLGEGLDDLLGSPGDDLERVLRRSGCAEETADASPKAVRSPGAELLAAHTDLVRRILSGAERAPRSPLKGWTLTALEERTDGDSFELAFELRNDERRMRLSLLPGDAARPALAQSPRVKLTHAPETPPPPEMRHRGLPWLCRMLDHYLARVSTENTARS